MHLPLGIRLPARQFAHPQSHSRARTLAAHATVVAAVLFGAIVLLVGGLEIAYVDQILPGVHVDGIDLSGMRPEVAARTLATRLPPDGNRMTIELPDGRAVALTPSGLGRTVDLAATVRDAARVGRTGGPAEAAVTALRAFAGRVDVAPSVRVDPASLGHAVSGLAGWWNRPERDASVTTVAGRFAAVPGAPGVILDQAALTSTLADELSRFPLPPAITVSARAAVARPEVTNAQADAAADAANRMAQPLRLTAPAPGLDGWQVPAATVRRWIRFVPDPTAGVRADVNEAAVRATVAGIANGIDHAVRPASLVLTATDRVRVSPSVDGRTTDVEDGVRTVVAVLRHRAVSVAESVPVALHVRVTPASVTTAQLRPVAQRMTVVSSWTTYYDPTSDLNGFGANIRLPTSYIDGSEVAPGATFDIWQAIGPVTPARGFRRGGVIVNGHSHEQGALGGGLCSVSTTLFNAALRAGYEIVERSPHFYYIDRYPLGLDATIFHNADGSGASMRFRNDTAYPLFIRGTNGPNFVRFSIITVPLGRHVSFSTPVVKNLSRGSTRYQQTSGLPKGTTKQVEWQADGMDVWVTRTVDASGAVIHRETYRSHYARMVGLILVGTG